MNRRVLLLAPLLALLGCSAPKVPDFTYFRLPRPPTVEPLAMPLFDQPVVVQAFGADGLYADQALVYALDAEGQQLRQYHYQLWTDSPTRLLQRRLIAELREWRVAARVTDELPASHPAIRVRGMILRFDRVPVGGGWHAVVGLKLRADAPDGAPLVDDYYRAERATGGATLAATMDAYGAALDEVFATFRADVAKAGAARHE